jgi:hypothetical protein
MRVGCSELPEANNAPILNRRERMREGCAARKLVATHWVEMSIYKGFCA